MSIVIPGLYKINNTDIPRACSLLAAAFHDDPLWRRILEGEKQVDRKLRTLFEIPLRYSLRYGAVFAPSEGLEGVMALLPGQHADMSAGGIIRSGALVPALKAGLRITMRMQPIGRMLPPDRKRHMQGRPFVYLFAIGVDPVFQNKGVGRAMIRTLVDACGSEGMAVYLETETEDNAAWYEKIGFRVLGTIVLDRLNVPMWEMAWFSG